MSERTQALKRIYIYIVGSICVFFWKTFARLLSLVNLVHTLITGKRNERIAYHSNLFCAFQYRFERYMNFTTDKNDMFSNTRKGIDPLDMEEY